MIQIPISEQRPGGWPRVPVSRLTGRQGWLAVAVLLHLTLVACGALRLTPWTKVRYLASVIDLYGTVTGSDNSYAFFSPDVPDQVIAILVARGRSGRTMVMRFASGKREADLRMATMMTLFTTVDFQDLHARSLAAYAFGRYPEAESVLVVIGLNRVPTMEDYQRGQSVVFEEFYRGEFLRRIE